MFGKKAKPITTDIDTPLISYEVKVSALFSVATDYEAEVVRNLLVKLGLLWRCTCGATFPVEQTICEFCGYINDPDYCEECHVEHHDTCSMTGGCPCCDETKRSQLDL